MVLMVFRWVSFLGHPGAEVVLGFGLGQTLSALAGVERLVNVFSAAGLETEKIDWSRFCTVRIYWTGDNLG